MTRVSERIRFLAAAAALMLCLVAGSPPRIVGDGGEYVAQALNFAQLDGPSLGRRAIPALERRIAALDPDLATWNIEDATMAGRDRRRDFVHFWFYALVAAPFVGITELLGISPLHAFTALNVLLLGAAVSLAGPRIGAPAAVLLFLSPVVWWLDKAHTEIFTVALLTIAFIAMRDRPWVAPIAAGAAATQNPPIAIVTALIVAVQAATRRGSMLRDWRMVSGAAIGMALAALQPIYTLLRHDTPSLLLYATRSGLPSLAELAAPVIDPSMGLIGNYPMLLLAGAIALGVSARLAPRALMSSDLTVAAATACLFLYSFAQTSNPHHGGTPSLTRYALWFIPLAVPLWRCVHEHRLLRPAVLWTVAIVSAVPSVFAFHPAVPQNSREPTWLAAWIWSRFPTLHDPLAEVFSETHLRVEGTTVPVATTDCRKVLLQHTPGGSWPLACLPAPLAGACAEPGALCYANRDGASYTFSRPSGRPPVTVRHVPEAAWPAEAEAHVRRILLEAGWPDMADAGLAGFEPLRQRNDTRVSAWRHGRRVLLVLQAVGPSPWIRLRPAVTTRGTLYAARTGTPVAAIDLPAGPDGLYDVVLPPGDDLYIAVLTEEGES